LPESHALTVEAVPIFHESYIRTYIERDVRALADFADLQTFGRFFRLMGALTRRKSIFSQLGRELGVTPQTSHDGWGFLRPLFNGSRFRLFRSTSPSE